MFLNGICKIAAHVQKVWVGSSHTSKFVSILEPIEHNGTRDHATPFRFLKHFKAVELRYWLWRKKDWRKAISILRACNLNAFNSDARGSPDQFVLQLLPYLPLLVGSCAKVGLVQNGIQIPVVKSKVIWRCLRCKLFLTTTPCPPWNCRSANGSRLCKWRRSFLRKCAQSRILRCSWSKQISQRPLPLSIWCSLPCFLAAKSTYIEPDRLDLKSLN